MSASFTPAKWLANAHTLGPFSFKKLRLTRQRMKVNSKVFLYGAVSLQPL